MKIMSVFCNCNQSIKLETLEKLIARKIINTSNLFCDQIQSNKSLLYIFLSSSDGYDILYLYTYYKIVSLTISSEVELIYQSNLLYMYNFGINRY